MLTKIYAPNNKKQINKDKEEYLTNWSYKILQILDFTITNQQGLTHIESNTDQRYYLGVLVNASITIQQPMNKRALKGMSC